MARAAIGLVIVLSTYLPSKAGPFRANVLHLVVQMGLLNCRATSSKLLRVLHLEKGPMNPKAGTMRACGPRALSITHLSDYGTASGTICGKGELKEWAVLAGEYTNVI